MPETGVIYAPFDGKVDMMFETGHAAGLVSEDGVELLIHMGIDTVNLEGKYFHPKKKSGDTVKKGEVLIEFERQAILDAGYDITTPVIVTNSDQFAKIDTIETEHVSAMDELIYIR